MGHRALVARERPDGTYDVYYSHWGGADLSLARDLDGEPWAHPQVDPDPMATGVPWDELLGAHLDALVHEALFVLPQAGPTGAYRPVWPGPLDCPVPLVAVRPGDRCDDTFVRHLLGGARDALVGVYEDGHLDAADAGAAFRDAVADAVGDREVVWLDR